MREFSLPLRMGIVSGLAGSALLAGIGLMCYLLTKRLGPFQPGSFLSSQLGLDQPYTASTTATTSSNTGTSTTTAGGAATATSTAGNATTPLYLTVNGADMAGNDVPPDASKPSVTSQPTYAATGCQAICSSDSRCKAAVYQPSTQLCWMKSAVTPGGIASATDRTVLLPVTSVPTGTAYTNMQFSTGIEASKLSLPTLSDCTSLCQGLSRSDCQGVTYDPDKTCHVKSMASGLGTNSLYNSWLKGSSNAPSSVTVNI